MSTATPIADPPLARRRIVAENTDWLTYLIAAAVLPGLIAYFGRLWSLPHYQFFPLALFGAWLLSRDPRSGGATAPLDHRAGSGVLLTLGLTLSAISIALDFPWLCAAASIVLIAAWLFQRGGRRGVVMNIPMFVMLLAVLRLPLNLDRTLMTNMQAITTRMAGGVLDVARITYVRLGNIIELPAKSLFVEEACSGVNSLFSVATCTIFYLLYTKRRPFVWFVLLLSVPVWTLAANVGRVVTVIVLYSAFGIEADTGLLHDALGLASFAVAVVLVYCTERLMTFYAAVLPPESVPDEEADLANRKAVRATSPAIEPPAPLKSLPRLIATVVASLLILWQVPLSIAHMRGYSDNLRGLNPPKLGAEFLPTTQGIWNRLGYETPHRTDGSIFGEDSQVWQYAGSSERAVVSFDYAFTGWHELAECYVAQGWEIESREATDARDGRPAFVLISMVHRPTARHGRVWFTLFDKSGRFIAPMPTDRYEQLRARLGRSLSEFSIWGANVDPDRASYQTQVFVEAYSPLSAPADENGRALFFTALDRLTSDPHVIEKSNP